MSQQKVYIEALGLVEGHFSGIGQYILGMLRGIDQKIEDELLKGNEVPRVYAIIPAPTYNKFKQFGFRHIQAKRFPLTLRTMSILWHRGKMPPIDLFCGKGYYIFTRFATMPLLFNKSAVVIYDISYETHKEYSDDGNARFLSRATKKSLQQVDTVFTISESAKNEIATTYGFPSSKIEIAYPAADQRYFYRRSQHEIDKVKEKYGIETDYILALSNLEPRKNLETLVDAYCALPEKSRKNLSLLLVGVSGWKTDKLFDKITALVEEGYDIIRPSKYVLDKDKPAIISGATTLVYPSHYEGFGMPPLEALACGTPVITSNNSSLPEVVGDAGTMLNASDTEGYTKQLQHHLDNKTEILDRSKTAGPKQANKFSWEACADIYWKVIKEHAQ